MFKNALNKPPQTLVTKTPLNGSAAIWQAAAQAMQNGTAKAVTDLSSVPAEYRGTTNPRIVFIANKQRIELYFDNKPTGSIRQSLKANDFFWNELDKCWHTRDTARARSYLEDYFNAEFGGTSEIDQRINLITKAKEPEPVLIPIPHEALAACPNCNAQTRCPACNPPNPPSEDKSEEPIPEPLAKYRQQVDDLIAMLDVRPADLMLMAIDFLHTAKVKRQ